MNIFKQIKQAKKYIELLTDTAKKSVSEKQQLFYLEMINSFVDLVNATESLLNKSVNVNVIDSLLLGRLDQLLKDQYHQNMSYSSKLFVLEKQGGEMKYVGSVDTDSVVHANYMMKVRGVTKVGLVVSSVEGEVYSYIDEVNSNRLHEDFYKEIDLRVDIHSVVRDIDTDLKYDSSLNREKVISQLRNIETAAFVKNPSIKITDDVEYNKMIDTLLDQFKQNIEWKR